MTGYLPHTSEDRRAMFDALGIKDAEDLFLDIPGHLRLRRSLKVDGPMSEWELTEHIRELARQNRAAREGSCFLGAGAYRRFQPSVVRHLAFRSEFYTAYTPYQAELSQGMLQAIFEYQTMICELTGMEVANASMYDGATALGESALMACGATRRNKVLISRTVNPHYREVVASFVFGQDVELVEIPYNPSTGTTDFAALVTQIDEQTAAVILQSPNFFGVIEKAADAFSQAKVKGALGILAGDPVSWALIQSPREQGAEIAVGEGQSLGLPLNYGGPYLGILAVTEKHLRRMPGRIVGETVDQEERRAFALTLQAREQHIRREKATSNICSNQALCALEAAIYMATMGPQGLRKVAELGAQKTAYARAALTAVPGVTEAFSGSPIFHEVVLRLPVSSFSLNEWLAERGIVGGLALESSYPELGNGWLISCTEICSKAQIDALVEAVRAFVGAAPGLKTGSASQPESSSSKRGGE